ncbi:MAG: hypothetical protein ACK56I_26955, partial [bacterium]
MLRAHRQTVRRTRLRQMQTLLQPKQLHRNPLPLSIRTCLSFKRNQVFARHCRLMWNGWPEAGK